ncbi:MAG: ROK family protein [Terriglobales bacterium]
MKALAIDLGGTHATCAVVEDHSILASQVVTTDGTAGLRPSLPVLVETLFALAKRSEVSVLDCAGLAFSFCAMVDSRTTRILSTNQKYDDARDLDLQEWAKREFGLPLRLENDARMALLGEYYAGAARGYDDVVMTTLGTGIGGAAMIGGRLLRGKHAQAGCLGGHIPADFEGHACTCGAIGCTEAEASGWAIPLIAKEWPGFAQSALAKESTVNFEALFRLAKEGDPVALAIRNRCLQVWAVGAVGLIHAYDPEIVVFGGGVMKSADVILPFVQSYVEKHAWTPWGRVKVRAAELGNNAGLLGSIPLLAEPI